MAIVLKNLYPPIVKDTLPAFIRTNPCRVYFSLSIYNNIADIKEKNKNGNIQITLINQKTNQSALNAEKYPSNIKIADFQEDESIQDDYKYYVEIDPENDLEDDSFALNQFYMVQLRLISRDAEDAPSSGVAIDTWLYDNKDYFSEWSKICLIKGIEQPHISIKANSEDEFVEDRIIELSSPLTDIVGKMYYLDNIDEKEYLKSYNINIYETRLGNDKAVVKSGQIYTNQYASNEINYEVNYDLLKDVAYTLAFTYTTNNSFTETLLYRFFFSSHTEYHLDCSATITPEEEKGRIKIDINFDNTIIQTPQDLVIKRASNKTNFRVWETVKIIPHNTGSLRHIWYDTTVENGVWYKYKIYNKSIKKVLQIDKPFICMFEDMFLTDGNKQLKIQFNPSVSDFKYNVTESQQTTLGSQYPYVRRNGNNFFRSFSIGGLISAYMDDDDWYDPNSYDEIESFTSRDEIYGESKYLYDNYDETYQSYIYEREFRQKVSDFLYENNVKLFRSMTQGNILIKLMNISLQPLDELGRKLYSFSASAVEIDDPSVQNLLKYNTINQYYYDQRIGNLTDTFYTESVFKKIVSSASLPSNEELSKITKLNIHLQDQSLNPLFFVKTLKDKDPIKYTINDGSLSLTFDDNNPMKDCYFYGIHEEGEWTLIEGFYASLEDITNPVHLGVYQVLEDINSPIVVNYLAYENGKMLKVTQDEVEENSSLTENDYTLLTGGGYVKYIWDNNEQEWYLFTDTGERLVGIQADIEYYYRIKGVN